MNSNFSENNNQLIATERKKWPIPLILLVISLPGQYFFASIFGLIFLCGSEGTGCPIWVSFPFLLVLLILDIIFTWFLIKKSNRTVNVLGYLFFGFFIICSMYFLWTYIWTITNKSKVQENIRKAQPSASLTIEPRDTNQDVQIISPQP